MLVADDDGELVGFAIVYIDIVSVRFGQRAWVEDLTVAPNWPPPPPARLCSTEPRCGRGTKAPLTSGSNPVRHVSTRTAATNGNSQQRALARSHGSCSASRSQMRVHVLHLTMFWIVSIDDPGERHSGVTRDGN